ncbi:MAG: xanthine dehydrogenase family protein subunit M, partial [Candidatus Dormibacteraeota bacterium]|nr:xanthine dehydrogenase family protein subunit M [Candidatus Dormibacteraeota bacterium]
PEAEASLRGKAPDEAAVRDAAALVSRHCNPTTDQRGPEDYKRHLAGELTARALRRALLRASGQEA